MLESISELISNDISLLHQDGRDGSSKILPTRPGAGDTIHAESLEQISRIVRSRHMYGSDMLCRLLEYLAQHSLNSSSEHLKEYQIATEILGRSSDFDPRSDASVRVQVGRLRAKLAKYYSTSGAHDPILIDIPKGRYTLCFERRSSARGAPNSPGAKSNPVCAETARTETLTEPASLGAEPPARRNRRLMLAALFVCALLVGVVLAGFLHQRTTGRSIATKNTPEVADALRIFWSPFLRSSEAPFVIFSSAAFIGDAESGLRYFDPARDSRDRVTHHYTGVGEVSDVVDLDRLFLRFDRRFRIKPSASFTLDDARDNDLILVGSPTENMTLRQIPSLHEFVFRRTPDGRDGWNQIIIDLHPRRGETSMYVPTPRSRPLNVDYAIIAFSRGLNHNRSTLILGGTSTIGTQAAVDFVCDRDSVEQLLQSMHVKSESDLRPFEALLRVKVANDVPIESQLVVLRRSEN